MDMNVYMPVAAELKRLGLLDEEIKHLPHEQMMTGSTDEDIRRLALVLTEENGTLEIKDVYPISYAESGPNLKYEPSAQGSSFPFFGMPPLLSKGSPKCFNMGDPFGESLESYERLLDYIDKTYPELSQGGAIQKSAGYMDGKIKLTFRVAERLSTKIYKEIVETGKANKEFEERLEKYSDVYEFCRLFEGRGGYDLACAAVRYLRKCVEERDMERAGQATTILFGYKNAKNKNGKKGKAKDSNSANAPYPQIYFEAYDKPYKVISHEWIDLMSDYLKLHDDCYIYSVLAMGEKHLDMYGNPLVLVNRRVKVNLGASMPRIPLAPCDYSEGHCGAYRLKGDENLPIGYYSREAARGAFSFIFRPERKGRLWAQFNRYGSKETMFGSLSVFPIGVKNDEYFKKVSQLPIANMMGEAFLARESSKKAFMQAEEKLSKVISLYDELALEGLKEASEENDGLTYLVATTIKTDKGRTVTEGIFEISAKDLYQHTKLWVDGQKRLPKEIFPEGITPIVSKPVSAPEYLNRRFKRKLTLDPKYNSAASAYFVPQCTGTDMLDLYFEDLHKGRLYKLAVQGVDNTRSLRRYLAECNLKGLKPDPELAGIIGATLPIVDMLVSRVRKENTMDVFYDLGKYLGSLNTLHIEWAKTQDRTGKYFKPLGDLYYDDICKNPRRGLRNLAKDARMRIFCRWAEGCKNNAAAARALDVRNEVAPKIHEAIMKDESGELDLMATAWREYDMELGMAANTRGTLN